MENISPELVNTGEQEPLLIFEDFVKRDHNKRPHYNNLILSFVKTGLLADIYANLPHIVRFRNEHPDLYEELCIQAQKAPLVEIIGDEEQSRPFEATLYEAYKIMHEYGFTDEVLFA